LAWAIELLWLSGDPPKRLACSNLARAIHLHSMIPSAAWLFLCRTRPSAQAPTLSDQPARFQPPVWFADGQKAIAALLFAVAFQLRSFEAPRLRSFSTPAP